MRLYTRTGDDGTTGLFDGSRVRKDHCRVESYAAVDELNSVLGWAAAAINDRELVSRVRQIQGDLFAIGAELATPAGAEHRESVPQIGGESVARLERWIDEVCSELPELTCFILPGGIESSARMHLARTSCRRAERLVVSLAGQERIAQMVIPYLNRLSDLFFAWARWLNHRASAEEHLWSAS